MLPVRHLFATAALAALPLGQPAQAAPTLCPGSEITLVSCPVGKKTASVCASPDLGPGHGVAQYRFGSPGHVELEFPTPPAHPRTFTQPGRVMFAAGGEQYLRVFNGDYAYVFYDGEGRGWQQRGVLVMRGERTLANLRCTGPDVGDYGRLPKGTLAPESEADNLRWLDQRPDPGSR